MILLTIRSLVAQIALFGGMSITTLLAFLYSFTPFCTHKGMIRFMSFGIGLTCSVVYFIAGVKLEYRGLENVPKTPCIFACKHQSLIETSFFFNKIKILNVYAYKREVSDSLLWGRISKQFGGIRVDRGLGRQMLENISNQANEYLNTGHSVTIFPEGTRIKAGTRGKFKSGIAKIYINTTYPIIPVALNSGVVLPKKSFFIYSGKLIIQFLPAMPFGLEEKEFLSTLEEVVHVASQKLYVETAHKYS